jgi:N-ethylmaleimide reductase
MAEIAAAEGLLSPFDLHGLQLKNRIVMAPMTRARAGEERLANPLMAEYYSQRASAGLIITEGTVISEQAIGWLNSPGIYTDQQAEAWRQVVDALHARGTPVFLQLWHCGRASHSSFRENRRPGVAPSAIPISRGHIQTPLSKQPHEIPRELQTDEVPAIVADYRRADLISFGRPFISNPDLVERFANGWPLNPPADKKIWYSFDPVGYTDFPRYEPSG